MGMQEEKLEEQVAAAVEVKLPEKAVLEKIANLKIGGVPEEQILFVSGLESAELQNVYVSAEFKAVYGQRLEASISRQNTMDEGWDAVEERAVAQVIEQLEFNADIKVSLMAAKIANTAKRNRVEGNRPIDATKNGHAVITLSQRFVTIIQQDNRSVTPMGMKPMPQRQHSLLAPSQVEKLLNAPMKSTKGDTVDESILLAELSGLAAE